MTRLLAGLLALLVVAATVPERPLRDHVVPPAGWEVTVEEEPAEGSFLDLLRDAAGTVVDDWHEATWYGRLEADEQGVFAIAHRFATADDARTVWLSVLRLAEEPDLDFAPRVLEAFGDTLAFGASTNGVTSEETHRLVGRDIVIFVRTITGPPELLPSATMLEVVGAHAAAFPRDQFDLPQPSTERDAAGDILRLVLLLTGLVSAVLVVLLVRRRRRPQD